MNAPDAQFSSKVIESVYRDYLENLLDGNRKVCRDTLMRLVDQKAGLKDIYSNLFKRSLYEVGDLWEKHEISVATEHLATSITEYLMGQLHPLMFAARRCGKRAVVSCATNEFHQVGGRMVADIFELNGWDTYFMGSNTQIDDLLKLISEKKPDVIALSLSIYANYPKLLKIVERIQALDSAPKIMVGGQGFRLGGQDISKRFTNVELVPTLEGLEVFIGENS